MKNTIVVDAPSKQTLNVVRKLSNFSKVSKEKLLNDRCKAHNYLFNDTIDMKRDIIEW
jgi:hypothetical protein